MSDSPYFDFSGKVVVVTGGSRGLGHAMALGFARCGAGCAIASRKLDACEATVAELRALGRDGSAHAFHAGRWSDCDRLYEEVYARWGRCDVLINNAGLAPVYPSLREHGEELFDKVMAVNLKGPFRLSALFGSRMAQEGGGAIINISSLLAVRPSAKTASYSASKAALNAITAAFAQEYGPKVRVNCIMAGAFHTDISKSWSHGEPFVSIARTQYAMGRAGEPEEIVGAALYLASPAASFTSGTVLTVDGGASFPRKMY
jgi:NAD(P)-dependent dehydrogenase (short-subunit alcohol dehydrogenase family)